MVQVYNLYVTWLSNLFWWPTRVCRIPSRGIKKDCMHMIPVTEWVYLNLWINKAKPHIKKLLFSLAARSSLHMVIDNQQGIVWTYWLNRFWKAWNCFLYVLLLAYCDVIFVVAWLLLLWSEFRFSRSMRGTGGTYECYDQSTAPYGRKISSHLVSLR